eukprot:gnl/TRDRNA2_/TRDRNA2_30014_c0_seq1.p1 gnl/TRDRNA2_/TRDRNA2_30014_c0~~gnl/TRDRNA2_/TRDRNA2_30014_c0_seq1.p1  ORF type:complete len:535 (+),score=99.22 gnl/TRDRNA2_/TRDRNA2_30014_c0_seq1:58-1662(+)
MSAISAEILQAELRRFANETLQKELSAIGDSIERSLQRELQQFLQAWQGARQQAETQDSTRTLKGENPESARSASSAVPLLPQIREPSRSDGFSPLPTEETGGTPPPPVSTVEGTSIKARWKRAESRVQQQRQSVDAMRTLVADDRTETGDLKSFVEKTRFDILAGVLIIANAVMIGCQSDYMARNPVQETPQIFGVLDACFCVAFSIELSLRIHAYGSMFFLGPAWKWNVFDCLMVGLQVLDYFILLIVYLVTGADASQGQLASRFSVLRLLRIIRLLRILRVARLFTYVAELRVLLVSIAGSLVPLFWAMVMLFLFTFIFGVFLTELVTDWKISCGENLEKHHELDEMFGTLTRSMLSLYQTMSEGIHWKEVMDPLVENISPWMALYFVFYMGFTLFALMNVITGIFVESAMRAAADEQQQVLLDQMRVLFEDADEDNSGHISLSEFQMALRTEKLQKSLKELDLPSEDALELFELLDTDNSGSIHIEDLASGALKIHGTASALKLATFMKENRLAMQQLCDFIEKRMGSAP